jgi:hypothetical protein
MKVFGFEKMLMNLLAEGSMGGGSTPPPDAPPAAPAETFTPPEWAKGLTVEHDILKAPMFSSVKTMDDVVKGYYHAQKMVGADKVVVPTKASTPEQWKEYYTKIGLPNTVEDYKVELPATLNNPDFTKNLVAKAHEMNVLPEQLSSIVAEMEKYNEQIIADYDASQLQEQAATADALKKEWGADFQRNLASAQRVIKHFGGDEMLNQVLESPLANDGSFLRLMASISSKLTKEDTFSSDIVSTFGTSSADAKKKINEIYANPNHAYFDSNSAKHRDAVEEMLKWQEIAAR